MNFNYQNPYRVLYPVKVDNNDIKRLFLISEVDPDITQAMRLTVNAAMNSTITTNIGHRIPSSGEGYESSKVINCPSFNEYINNCFSTERDQLMYDLLKCGICVVQASEDPYFSAISGNGPPPSQYPNMLDVGPIVKSLIVSGHLSYSFGSRHREHGRNTEKTSINGGVQFLPSSFPSWMNDPYFISYPNTETIKNVVDKGIVEAKRITIRDGHEEDYEGTIDEIVNPPEEEEPNTNPSASRRKRGILSRTEKSVTEPLRYQMRRVDPRNVDIYAICDANGTIVDARAIPSGTMMRNIRSRYMNKGSMYSMEEWDQPMYGMRVHICTSYLSVDMSTMTVEMTSPVKKCITHVTRREDIERGLVSGMEKNLNMPLGLTRIDDGTKYRSGAEASGFGGDNGNADSLNMDAVFFNERRLLENMVNMNYNSVLADSNKRTMLAQQGVTNITLSGIGYGEKMPSQATPLPVILPPNSQAINFPGAILSPMLLPLMNEKRDNIYKVFGVRPPDQVLGGGGDASNTSVKHNFAAASTSNAEQAKVINREMRVVYAVMLIDQIGDDLMQDAIDSLEYERAKEDSVSENDEIQFFTERDIIDIDQITSDAEQNQKYNTREENPVPENFMLPSVAYDSYTHMMDLYSIPQEELEEKQRWTTKVIRTFVRHLRFSVVIPNAVNMSLENLHAAQKLKYLDGRTVQGIFMSNNGISHQQMTAPLDSYDDELDLRIFKENVYKMAAEYSTRKMHTEFEDEEREKNQESEMDLMEAQAQLDKQTQVSSGPGGGGSSSSSVPKITRRPKITVTSLNSTQRTKNAFASNDRKGLVSRVNKSLDIGSVKRDLRSLEPNKHNVLKGQWRPGAHKETMNPFNDARQKID